MTDLHNGTYTASLTAGTAPGQAVIAGALGGVAMGEPITVTFVAQCVVPRVRGKSLAAAKGALRRAHCGVGTVKTVRSSSVPAGRVIAQSRAAGRRLEAGARVSLTVSKGRRRD